MKKNPVVHTEVVAALVKLSEHPCAADIALQKHHNNGELYPMDVRVPEHVREAAYHVHAVHRVHLRVTVRADGTCTFCVVRPPKAP